MEANPQTLTVLAQYLAETINPDPDTRKKAESFLLQNEPQPGYAILLLSILDKLDVPEHIRQGGAVRFKNFVKKHWVPDEDSAADIIPAQTRDTIKQNIIKLMVSVPSKIQSQLSEAVSIISDSDYPEAWPGLMTDLVSRLDGADLNVIKGVLLTVQTITLRYRDVFASDPLYTEINYTMTHFFPAYTKLYEMVTSQIPNAGQNPAQLKTLLELLTDMFEILHSLCWQDLPQAIFDNFKTWNGELLKYLTFVNQTLAAEEAKEDEPGTIVLLKTSVLGTINLYMMKFDSDFQPFVQDFVRVVWEMLVSTGLEKRNDPLIANGLLFLTTVAKSCEHAFFGQKEVLEQICTKVVLPNMRLRDEDEELFEDSPSEYIQMDIEGSDTETRRRTACELVKGLCKNYEQLVTTTFGQYVGQLISEYQANTTGNWKSKDAAIYLVVALGMRNGTYSLGATGLNDHINIPQFLEQHILPEMQDSNVNNNPILKADAIKFITTFRHQITAPVLPHVLPLIINHLKSSSYVVRSYAAGCIEKVLAVKDGQAARFGVADIQSSLSGLLENLFGSLTIGMGGNDKWENEYTMKAILRVTGVAKGALAPFVEPLMGQLNRVLECVCGNPRNPQFNHYLFETVASLIRFVCEANPPAVEQFENVVMDPFQQVLVKGVDEFTPYVFQIFGQILELRSPPLPDRYSPLFTGLLHADNWERHGNVPALNLLLVAFIHKAPLLVVQSLQPVMGIFQRLVSLKALDHEGLTLLTNVFQSLPLDKLQAVLPEAFKVLMIRLQTGGTTKYRRALIRCMSLFVYAHGVAPLSAMLDQMQVGLLDQVLSGVWLPEVQKIGGFNNRKCCGVGLVKLLEAPEIQGKPQLWLQVLSATLKLIDSPCEKEQAVDEDFIEKGFDNEFSKLQYAAAPVPKFENSLPETQAALMQAQKSLVQLMPVIQQLPEEARQKLKQYVQIA